MYEPFSVPLWGSYLEIFEGDTDGPLLLAVFPLPEPESLVDDRAQRLWVTLEGAQRVTLEIVLDAGTGGEERAYVIQLAYAESGAMETQGDRTP